MGGNHRQDRGPHAPAPILTPTKMDSKVSSPRPVKRRSSYRRPLASGIWKLAPGLSHWKRCIDPDSRGMTVSVALCTPGFLRDPSENVKRKTEDVKRTTFSRQTDRQSGDTSVCLFSSHPRSSIIASLCPLISGIWPLSSNNLERACQTGNGQSVSSIYDSIWESNTGRSSLYTLKTSAAVT